MITKLLYLCRDRPFVFFSIALPFLLLLIVLFMFIAATVNIYYLVPIGASDTTVSNVVMLVFLPVLPFFYVILWLVAEFLISFGFRMFGLSVLLDVNERKFLHFLLNFVQANDD